MPSQESIMVKQMLKASLTNQTQEFNLEAARQGLEALSAFTPVAPDVKVEKITVEGIPSEWVTAPNAKEDHPSICCE
ncbi:hypothetical protein [Neobacillus niacini]|uniref:hypothetical protein n=1 Tax=Neobacillus niacini TaxID=86668 RepID=UPI0021CB616C|nr:hypothetical protein [Neobacillus niacini]MCM3764542.1 hypothetical protein [Neobacillus niacini]